MIPVYADDEGTPARDAVLIEDGILTEFMNSRETAARLGIAPTGSARAYAPERRAAGAHAQHRDPARARASSTT